MMPSNPLDIGGRASAPLSVPGFCDLFYRDLGNCPPDFVARFCGEYMDCEPQVYKRVAFPFYKFCEARLYSHNRADWSFVRRDVAVCAASLIKFYERRHIPLSVYKAFSYGLTSHGCGLAVTLTHSVLGASLSDYEGAYLASFIPRVLRRPVGAGLLCVRDGPYFVLYAPGVSSVMCPSRDGLEPLRYTPGHILKLV